MVVIYQKWYSIRVKTLTPFVLFLLLIFSCSGCGTAAGRVSDRAIARPATPSTADESLRAYASKQVGEYYYSVYFSGMKIGWRVLRISLEQSQEGDALVYDDETLFLMSLNGEVLKTTARSRCVYRIDEPGLISSCSKEENANRDLSSANVILKGDEHVATINYNGQLKQFVIPLSKDTLMLAKELETWIFAERKAGDTFTMFGLDVDGLRTGHDSIDSKSTVTFNGRKTTRWKGREVDVTQLSSVDESGIRTRFEMVPGGITTSIHAGPLEFRLEDENAVSEFSTSDLDVAQTIPSNLFLGNPKEIASLRLSLKTDQAFILPETRRQRVLSTTKDSILVELRPEYLADENEPLSDAAEDKYTAPTLLISSDHEDIVNLARFIVGDETDPVRMADLIKSWVYLNIEKTYGSNTSSALTVLQNRSGDCTELSLLFTALARAVGIPARELTGLVYDDLNNVFGWHAWVEFHNGRQWVSVDPTWNELFANATHIRLSRDDEDMASVALLNRLRIEVESFETR